jgi:hypothetical protein
MLVHCELVVFIAEDSQQQYHIEYCSTSSTQNGSDLPLRGAVIEMSAIDRTKKISLKTASSVTYVRQRQRLFCELPNIEHRDNIKHKSDDTKKVLKVIHKIYHASENNYDDENRKTCLQSC